MIIDSNSSSEYLTYRDIKFLFGSFIVITTATILSLYIYYNVIKKQVQPVQTSLSKVVNMPLTTIDINNAPKLMKEITTCEYYDDNWNPVLTHTFYGNTEDEIDGLIDSHKQTDSFFRASFEGVFSWKDGAIKLRNIESDILTA